MKNTFVLAIALLCIGLIPLQVHATAAFVQAKSNTFWVGGSGTTETLTFTSNIGAGDVVVIHIGWDTTTSTISSVKDGNGASYSAVTYATPASALCPNSTSGTNSTYVLANSVGGAGTAAITVTWSADPGAGSFAAQEFSGVATASPVDKADCQVQVNPGTGANAVTSPSVTTTGADALSGWSWDDGIQNVTWMAGTNVAWTIPASATNPTTQINEYFIQSASASVATNFTDSQGISSPHTVIVALKPTGGGGGSGVGGKAGVGGLAGIGD